MQNYDMKRLFEPKSICIVGANEKKGYAGRLIRNLQINEYQGNIYPVNPNHSEVLGLKCYPSVSAVGEKIDLAVVVVKARFVLETLKECGECGVGGVLIITAGFREVDPVLGGEQEAEMKRIADQYGMPMIGPNCIGFASIFHSMWSCSISGLPKNPLPKGSAALISQSGAAGFGPILNIARDHQVGLKYMVSTGNEAVLNMCDYLEYFLADPEIRSVSMLIEGLKDTKRFIRLAEKAKKAGKTIIVIKSGESEVGQRAAKSHTASMTGDIALFNAMCRQYGIIKADDYEELVELARMAQNPNALKGRKICVVSHSGGIGGCTGDRLGKQGFDVPVFTEATRNHIDEYLKGFGSPSNPLDLTGQMRSPNLPDILLTVEKNEEIDAFVIASHGSDERFDNVISAIRQVRHPVYFCWTGSMFQEEGIRKLTALDIPFTLSIDKMAIMLNKLVQAFESQKDAAGTAEEEQGECAAVALPVSEGIISELEAKKILSSAGISVPERWELQSEADVVKAAAELKGRKAVMKIVSGTITHKTDVGGVLLGLRTEEELKEGFRKLQELQKNLPGIESFMLEEMCGEGLDLVLGIREDESFGSVLMLGLGGIYTELFRMISLRLIPARREDIEHAIDEIPGLSKLLSGFRGHIGYDRKALVDAVYGIAEVVQKSEGRISLVEINPLRILTPGQGVVALDCVMELKGGLE